MTTELRLALAMRGGVSLAVWIGGAITEIDLLRRAEDGRGRTGLPPFWRPLLKASGYDEVVVDVLAGASAGGLNGAVYAASQVYDFRFDGIRAIWLTIGSTEGLVRRKPPWPSLFKGDDYFLGQVHDGLAALVERRAAPAPPASGRRRRIDLALSATMMEPVLRPLPSPEDEALFERRYAGGFRFRQPQEPWLPTDLCPADSTGLAAVLWRLAIAARATSSYPAAFEAARVRSSRRPSFDAPPQGVGTGPDTDLDGTFLDRSTDGEFIVADGGILDNIPIRCALDYVATAPADGPTARVLLYLQPGAPGAPKRASTAAIDDRRATFSVARGVVGARVAGETINEDIAAMEAYNEAVQRANRIRSATFESLLSRDQLRDLAKARRPSYEVSRASFEARATFNLLLDPRGVMGEDQLPVRVAGQEISDTRWRSPMAGWPQPVREMFETRLGGALEASLGRPGAGLLTRTGDVGPLLRVTDLLTQWVRSIEATNPEVASPVKSSLYSVRAFLAAILERTSRLAWVACAARVKDGLEAGFVDQAQPALARMTMVDPRTALATKDALGHGEVGPLEEACRQALTRIEGVVIAVMAALGETLPAEVAAAGPPGPSPTGTEEPQDLLATIADLLIELVSPLASVPVPETRREDTLQPGQLLHRVLGNQPLVVADLEALDVLCLPEFLSGMPGRRGIDFRRLSSANRTPLAPDLTALLADAKRTGRWWDAKEERPAAQEGIHVSLKLAGNEMSNFSAFLLAEWRANDWLWGRLDAVPTLVDLLVRREGLIAHLGLDKGPAAVAPDPAAVAPDPVDVIRDLVVPPDHPWRTELTDRVWNPCAADIAGEVQALKLPLDPTAPPAGVKAIRSALIARRQWEILGEECRLPKGASGTPPGVDPAVLPPFDEVLAWVRSYRVGAETLSDNQQKPELLDRFDELATAATETLLWNAARPGSPLPHPPRMVAKAISRVGPKLGHRVARHVVNAGGGAPDAGPRPASSTSRARVVVPLLGAALLVLGVLGWFIDRQAFLIGLGVSVLPLGLLGAWAWWSIRRVLTRA